MDFKSLISKIDSIETPREPAARLETPKRVQLDEETSIKFLSGTTTLKEAAEIMEKKLTKAEKEKKEEVVKSMKKDKSDFKKRYGEKGEEVMHATATKIAKKKAEGVEINNAVISELDMNLIKAAQKGQEGKPVGKPDAESDKNVKKKYGYRMDGEPAERDDDETKQDRRGRRRQNTGENVELDREKFKLKFFSLVEAKKKETAKTVKGKKAEEKMDEGSKPDFLDIDKHGNKKEPMKKAAKEAEKAKEEKETTGLSAKQKKLPAGLQKAIAAKKGKKTVKESFEPKMSFRDMMKLVVESGGQQQIDPLDKTLFAWATRVAQQKFNESTKAEVYAGLVYERMGGRFEMFDVLSEDRLDENWKKKLAAAAMAGVMGLGAMGGASAADMPGKDPGADRPVAAQSEYGSMIEIEGKVKDLAKVDKKAAKSYEATKSYYTKLLGKAKSSADTKEIDKEYTKALQSIIDHSTMMKSM